MFNGLNRNKPRNITYIEPEFNIVRREGARFVLVADVSGSMADYVYFEIFDRTNDAFYL
jgi:uncharacterized protein with von Willebrand factor type A (vWA) domain